MQTQHQTTPRRLADETRPLRSRWDQSRSPKSWRGATEQRTATRLDRIDCTAGILELWRECEGRYSVSLGGRTVVEADTLFGAELEASNLLRRAAR